MRIALVGYGRMGREVEIALRGRGHSVAVRVDPAPGADRADLCVAALAEADVAIEFSQAAAVRVNAAVYAAAKKPAVVGTTGWKKDGAELDVRHLVDSAGIGYIQSSNFSVGANLFFALAEKAAGLLNSLDVYDIGLYEIHHNQKKDSPSGTALTAAERIVRALARKKRIVTDRLDRQIEPDELQVGSLRTGAAPGLHSVVIDCPADTIEITHTARNRNGFALGAVMAAEWLAGRTGYFSAEDFFSQLFA
jgi:4-hydroxy-tetrahydrodipicolinate reductase